PDMQAESRDARQTAFARRYPAGFSRRRSACGQDMRNRIIRLTVLCLSLGPGLDRAAAAQVSSRRILVVPFENARREPSIVWLGEASAVLLADDLNALGAAAITRDERREAFERLEVPSSAVLTDATIIRIGQLVGASEVVTGSLQLEGDVLVV